MNSLILSLAALIPAVLLCWYIYSKDKIEKEPAGLLFLLFLLGVIVYFPAIFCENYLIGLFDQLFESEMTYSLSGIATFRTEKAFAFHSMACGFGAIALIEEILKWIPLYFITYKNKNFDHLFDGIVYSTFLALGFAAAENVFYAVRDGWTTFILRSLTSVPGHMTFGVLMGYCYTMWHMYLAASKKEKELSEMGRIVIERPFHSRIWLVASCLLPIFLHGCYSFLRFYTSEIMTIIFYIFIFVVYVVCFIGVHCVSDADSAQERFVDQMIRRKYSNYYSKVQK